jgi:DNA-directed RNA polymerase alpha subunit
LTKAIFSAKFPSCSFARLTKFGGLMPNDENVYWKARALAAEAEVKWMKASKARFMSDVETALKRFAAGDKVDPWNANLFKRVSEFEFSTRAETLFANAGIEFIYQLVEKTESEVLKSKGAGRGTLNNIKEVLSDISLSLGMRLRNFPSHLAER